MIDLNLNKDNRWIEKNYPSIFHDIDASVKLEISWKEKYYLFTGNISEVPKCPVCNNNLKFLSIKRGYTKFCSRRCTAIGTVDDKKNTCILKYGVDNPMKSILIKDKFDKSISDKYGVSNVSKLLDIKNKKKDTMMSNYGVEYNSQRDIIKDILSENMVNRTHEMNQRKSLNIFDNLNAKVEMFDIKVFKL